MRRLSPSSERCSELRALLHRSQLVRHLPSREGGTGAARRKEILKG